MLRSHRVSLLLLCGALAALVFAAWAASLDTLFIAPRGWQLSHWLAGAATLAGLLCISCAMRAWRHERRQRAGSLPPRDRLLCEHPSVDPLTRVGDADCLREQLRIDYQHGRRNGSLLMLDIDNFHLINQDYGEREGDRLLQSVTQVLQLNLRASDLLCRYAGDRFGVLLRATDADGARAMGELLRRALASLRHHPHNAGQPISVSMRFVARPISDDPRQLLREANRALERRMVEAGGEAEPAASAA